MLCVSAWWRKRDYRCSMEFSQDIGSGNVAEFFDFSSNCNQIQGKIGFTDGKPCWKKVERHFLSRYILLQEVYFHVYNSLHTIECNGRVRKIYAFSVSLKSSRLSSWVPKSWMAPEGLCNFRTMCRGCGDSVESMWIWFLGISGFETSRRVTYLAEKVVLPTTLSAFYVWTWINEIMNLYKGWSALEIWLLGQLAN